MSKVIKNPTLFVDIDGTLVKYRKFSELSESVLTPIQDVIDFVNEHYDNGSVVMITTARPSTYELFTKQELEKIGVKYHQLIMDCGRGTRVILNDKDPENPIDRAIGINLNRNGGLENITIPEEIKPYESN
jgi:hydroxymethylpyrimidine pyrophosphatase-like HAD family hydrolase